MITVFSDPHLGRQLQAHTTAASRERMAQCIFNAAHGIASTNFELGFTICAGDLFDKYQNPEAVILQGLAVASNCTVTMAGNHDVCNDVNKVGSLQLLEQLLPQNLDAEILITKFGRSDSFLRHICGIDFVFVPHHATQELFEQSLKDAEEWARQRRITRDVKPKAYLVLHCNYDSGFDVDQTALGLTRREAQALLDAGFDYILIGHDHHPREDLNGRVIVLGNTHPTGFGDIGPKRILQIKGSTHEFVEVWSPARRYVQLDAEMLMEGIPEHVQEGVQFIDIVGKLAPEHVMHLAKAVRGLWTCYQPLAIRNRAEIVKVTGGDSVSHDFASIDKVVREDLADEPELLELFSGYWAATARREEEGE